MSDIKTPEIKTSVEIPSYIPRPASSAVFTYEHANSSKSSVIINPQGTANSTGNIFDIKPPSDVILINPTILIKNTYNVKFFAQDGAGQWYNNLEAIFQNPNKLFLSNYPINKTIKSLNININNGQIDCVPNREIEIYERMSYNPWQSDTVPSVTCHNQPDNNYDTVSYIGTGKEASKIQNYQDFRSQYLNDNKVNVYAGTGGGLSANKPAQAFEFNITISEGLYSPGLLELYNVVENDGKLYLANVNTMQIRTSYEALQNIFKCSNNYSQAPNIPNGNVLTLSDMIINVTSSVLIVEFVQSKFAEMLPKYSLVYRYDPVQTFPQSISNNELAAFTQGEVTQNIQFTTVPKFVVISVGKSNSQKISFNNIYIPDTYAAITDLKITFDNRVMTFPSAESIYNLQNSRLSYNDFLNHTGAFLVIDSSKDLLFDSKYFIGQNVKFTMSVTVKYTTLYRGFYDLNVSAVNMGVVILSKSNMQVYSGYDPVAFNTATLTENEKMIIRYQPNIGGSLLNKGMKILKKIGNDIVRNPDKLVNYPLKVLKTGRRAAKLYDDVMSIPTDSAYAATDSLINILEKQKKGGARVGGAKRGRGRPKKRMGGAYVNDDDLLRNYINNNDNNF